MVELGLFEPLAIALGVGLLVGMQRERETSPIAAFAPSAHDHTRFALSNAR